MDQRLGDELRQVKLTRNFLKHAEGSVLIEMGDTKVVCSASFEDKVPPFLKNQGLGWITAEYGMIPRSTAERNARESSRGRQGGRTHEIQRLIGRSLRAVTDRARLGERTLWIDCDVIQADGGTRTAAITGAFVALVDACSLAKKNGLITTMPVVDYLAAVSVGRVEGALLLDLTYEEDSKAEVDMNVVMTGQGRYVEVQGTAERAPFGQEELQGLLALASRGVQRLIGHQQELLGPLE